MGRIYRRMGDTEGERRGQEIARVPDKYGRAEKNYVEEKGDEKDNQSQYQPELRPGMVRSAPGVSGFINNSGFFRFVHGVNINTSRGLTGELFQFPATLTTRSIIMNATVNIPNGTYRIDQYVFIESFRMFSNLSDFIKLLY